LRAESLEIRGVVNESYTDILNPAALAFLEKLAQAFEGRRQELLAARKVRQEELRQRRMPCFLKETADVRAAEWTVAPIPADLQDRRVEITLLSSTQYP
jgi:malate synthase